MKTIQLSTDIRQNSSAARVLGHPGKDFRPGTYIDINDNLSNVLKALKVGFDELDYFSYDLIQLRAKQLPENVHTVHLAPVEPKKPKTLIYKAQTDPVVLDMVIGRLLKTMHPCRNCGDFIPLPSRLNKEGGFYKRDAYCRSCADIVVY